MLSLDAIQIQVQGRARATRRVSFPDVVPGNRKL
jgi:hypothetical protein